MVDGSYELLYNIDYKHTYYALAAHFTANRICFHQILI
jgi:hypothetical protein